MLSRVLNVSVIDSDICKPLMLMKGSGLQHHHSLKRCNSVIAQRPARERPWDHGVSTVMDLPLSHRLHLKV
jgi:hypothetical protein